MKKTLSLLLTLVMLLALATGCAADPNGNASSGNLQPNEENNASADPGQDVPDDSQVPDDGNGEDEDGEDKPDEPDTQALTIRLGGLKGPTTIGMLKLLSDADAGTTANNYEYTLAASADELTPLLVKGELDIIAAPVNLGAVLYNNNDGAVQFAAINTLGVVYIVEKGGETVNSVADLKDKTIYATGKGSTPEYALRYLLAQNGLDPDADVTIEWKSEPTEVVALMNESETSIAMLPQPFVTVAQTQVEGLRIALDLTEQWNALDNGSMFITAGLIVRREFAENHPEQLAAFLEEYKASTEYANEYVEETAALCESYNIVKAGVAKTAIPFCNITYIDGDAMAEAVSAYLSILYEQNPKAVGGTLPGEDFYYKP